jgi:hypothetical protein
MPSDDLRHIPLDIILTDMARQSILAIINAGDKNWVYYSDIESQYYTKHILYLNGSHINAANHMDDTLHYLVVEKYVTTLVDPLYPVDSIFIFNPNMRYYLTFKGLWANHILQNGSDYNFT